MAKIVDGGPTDPVGPLQRPSRAPMGMRTDGIRMIVRGSQAMRWMVGILVVVGGLPTASGEADTLGLSLGVVIVGGFWLLGRRVRVVFHREGWVLAAGRHGPRWIDTRPGARIYIFDQYTGRGSVTAVGIAGYDTSHAVDGISFVKGAKTDRLGPLGNFFGAARALRILEAVDQVGCWPEGCWVDLTNAGPIIDPRGRRARRHLQQAGLTRPPAEVTDAP